MSKKIIKRELLHANYTVSKDDPTKDAVFIKEVITADTGETKSVFRWIENYQQSFWITKPEFRNHNDKKEAELLVKLDEYRSNRATLALKAKRILTGEYIRNGSFVKLTDVAKSPYLYGCDITPPVLIAQEYLTKYGVNTATSKVAVLDYEWDVVHGTDAIISGCISCGETLHIAVVESFLGDLKYSAKEQIQKCLDKYCNLITARVINPIITIEKDPSRVIIALFNTVHTIIHPDIVTCWNIKGDMEHMLDALKENDIPPEKVFCSPIVPDEYKYFIWREDKPIKMKADGTSSKKHISDLWHTIELSAEYIFVDAMLFARHCRSREQQRSSYSLDSFLNDFLGLGKLEIEGMPEGDHSLSWHKEAQSFKKIPYTTYMAFDCVGLELLDEKTKDLSKSLRGYLGITEVSKLKSNPKQLADDMHFELLRLGKVIATTSNDMTHELDHLLPSLKGWIVNLAPELVYNVGRNLIKEYRYLATSIVVHARDIDVSSSYPSSTVALNVSAATRVFELCNIVGLSKYDTRALGINLTGIKPNALTMARAYYRYPKNEVLLQDFQEFLEAA